MKEELRPDFQYLTLLYWWIEYCFFAVASVMRPFGMEYHTSDIYSSR